VLVLRTFSKAYGLAGLRVGYALASQEFVEVLRRTRVPFGVSTLAETAAIACLAAPDELASRVAATIAERERVLPELLALGFCVPSSEGNFWWVPTPEAARLEEQLLGADILVKRFGEALRISVGLAHDNDRLLDCLSSARTVALGG
jgi:histidinol-phosphate aminotransferase